MEKINRTPFGQRLFDSREAIGMTQEVAAKKAGMAQSTLAEAEIFGKRSGYTSQLADLYKVSAKWLATGKRDSHLSVQAQGTGCPPSSEAKILPEVRYIKTQPPSAITELVRIAGCVSEEGLKMILSYASHVETTHPAEAKQTPEFTG